MTIAAASSPAAASPSLRLSAPTCFANPQVVSPSWYPIAPSRRIRPRRPHGFDIAGRRLVAWRDARGELRVASSRCPHLGADLSQGTVDAGFLRCAFHHWAFDTAGRCVDAPGQPPETAPPDRCLRTLPVVECYGFAWCHVGGEPRFDLPRVADADRFRVVRPPSQHIAAHPHLVIANGLDVTHFQALHGMSLTRPATLEAIGEHALRVNLRGRPRSRLVRLITGTTRRDIVASFTTIGGNLALSTVIEPIAFHVLFAAAPTADGSARTQTVWLLPRGLGFGKLRAVALMASMLHDDRRILERIDFHPSFTDADQPLRRFAAIVDALGPA